MCGIFGWIGLDSGVFAEQQLHQMQTILSHRGPDNTGEYFDLERGMALGHNRLSIIDVSENGKQPMLNSQTGDVLSFNGEIYNYRQVRSELRSLGHEFQSQSDTEVLLYALAQWGLDCLDRVKGMYAFAFWQSRTETLYLARDPMGVKPLYYWHPKENQGLVFASEVKAFLNLPGFSRSIDPESLNQYLEFGYSFGNSTTIFRDIRKLQPGHTITIFKDKPNQLNRYFCPEIKTAHNTSKETFEQELYMTLDEVVKQQLISDVPVGLLLSGGIDSSILAAIASKHSKINTYSFGFSHSDVDERNKSRLVSEHVGSIHEEFTISPEEVVGDLEITAGNMDDLFADWGLFSTQIMYKKCRQRGVKVALVGEGADELFGGYWGRFSPSLGDNTKWGIEWKLFQMYRKYLSRRYGRGFSDYRKVMKKYLVKTNGDLFQSIRLFESREQLSNNFVMKVDKASMAESVEARVPYLDSRVATLAYKIPRDMLIGDNYKTKSILGSMASRYELLPDEITRQQKFGIGLPGEWINESDSFHKFASAIVLDKAGWTYKLGFGKSMEDFFYRGKSGYRFPSAISIFRNLAWKLLLLNLWSRCYQVEPSVNR